MKKSYGVNELRRMYLEFFESKEHLAMKSFSLVPHNDNSLLLINAGMAPLKPYFTGQEIPPRKRVTTCQKCIRTGDIENVTTAITAVSEAYPELKSNENYKELMNELSITENLIAEYRSNYNRQIKEYNRYVRKFPTRIFLSILGYEVQEYSYLDYDAPVDAPQNLFEE